MNIAQPSEVKFVELSTVVLAALADLQQAHEYASRLSRDRWEFAVELEYLVTLGATVSDLRFLAINGYVESAREITQPGDPARRYEASRNLAFDQASCFVVTEAGLALLKACESRHAVSSICLCGGTNRVEPSNGIAPANESLLPHWDADSRSLTLGDQVVRRYCMPSPNQQAILTAFQESGWSRSVDDPLPYLPLRQAKDRLHATIRCLNANQENRLLRFRGDGTGQAVLWELFTESPAELAAYLRPAALPLRRAA